MTKVILYAGGFRLPDKNASAQRAIENAKLFERVGYRVVLAGKLEAGSVGKGSPEGGQTIIDGLECWDIRKPDANLEFGDYQWHIDSLRWIGRRYGQGNLFAVVAYNYPPVALAKLVDFCHQSGIPAIAECTEWYGFEGRNIRRNLSRLLWTELRMRIAAKKARNVICATTFLEQHFRTCETVVLPFVVDAENPKWSSDLPSRRSARRRLIYAGSPGIGLSKDYVDLLVAAVFRLKRRGLDFEFVIAGLGREEFLTYRPRLRSEVEYLGANVRFLGRLAHGETIREVRLSDWFVFVRPDNRVSRAGFPTKLAEAFTCGVPTITNRTGDIGLYVRTGQNGILLEGLGADEVDNALVRAIETAPEELRKLKETCKKQNPFLPEAFEGRVRDFLASLRL